MFFGLIGRQRGFTMVELLVVISIIGILATAVLAALNPVEQLQKARDTARKADAQTLLGAIDRFQATFGCLPWMFDDATDACTTVLPVPFATLQPDGTGMGVWNNTFINDVNSGYLFQLTNNNELKTQFSSRSTIQNAEMWIAVDANGQPSVCFTPESRTARSGGLGPIRNWVNQDAAEATANPPIGGATVVPDCSVAYDEIALGASCAVCVPQ